MVRGVSAKLRIDSEAQLKYAMREQVEYELDHLHQQGIIKPVQF